MNNPARTPPPGLGYHGLTAGWRHACALKADGTAVCWGNNDDRSYRPGGQAVGPAGHLQAGGRRHLAHLRAARRRHPDLLGRRCRQPPTSRRPARTARWRRAPSTPAPAIFRTESPAGATTSTAAPPPSYGGAARISAGRRAVCTLQRDDSVVCAGLAGSGGKAPAEKLKSLSVGSAHACGLRADGTALCWGANGYGEATAPPGQFVMVRAGGSHSCGVRADGSGLCWGSSFNGITQVPAGTWKWIAAGGDGTFNYTCGLRSDDSVTCWGNGAAGNFKAPTGTFQSIDAGPQGICGLRFDGTVDCWGITVTKTLPGTFARVTGGGLYAAALRADGTAIWFSTRGGTYPMPGTWRDVDVTTGGITHCFGFRVQ